MFRDDEPCRYRNCTVHPRTYGPRLRSWLTKAEVFEICEMIVDDWDRGDIASWFQISVQMPRLIVSGERYAKHVKEWMEQNERTDWTYAYESLRSGDGRGISNPDVRRRGDARVG